MLDLIKEMLTFFFAARFALMSGVACDFKKKIGMNGLWAHRWCVLLRNKWHAYEYCNCSTLGAKIMILDL